MVNELLLNHARQILGSQPRRVLVTGGTGFVGSHLARCMAEAGHHVTVAGRNQYRTHRILHPNIEFIRGDIRDATHVQTCCANQNLVFHCAALTTPWGDRTRIAEINVGGTENVIAACIRQAVQRLVYVSSTSVFFSDADLYDHPDDAPYPFKMACPYSGSKQRAEEIVRHAAAQGLNVFTVRARAVFGEGDTTLLPRLIQAARAGRLRQIGHGENLVDLTYIDNLVLALILAAERGQAGWFCTVTNNEPMKLWDLLPEIFSKLKIPYRGKRIPYPLAHALAGATELLHWALPRLGEPAITRYTAGLLAKNQVFSLANARRELDYQPIVSMKEGVDRTIRSWQLLDQGHSGVSVKLHCFTTGYTTGNRRIVERTAAPEQTKFHALVGLFDHPTYGLSLFDTGYASHLRLLRGRPAWLYNRMLPTTTSEALSIAAQLRQLDIDPQSIQRIVISHFHPDHIAGLRDFPNAELIASCDAWKGVRGRKGLSALARHAFLPGLLPDDFAERIQLIETFTDPGMGPFVGCHDLFGDGSVRLFELPGHAAGQIGALLQTGINDRDFLVADAAWTSSAIRDLSPPHWATRLFLHNFAEMKRTLEKVHRFQQQFPAINLLPTHCPEVATRFGFDEQVRDRS